MSLPLASMALAQPCSAFHPDTSSRSLEELPQKNVRPQMIHAEGKPWGLQHRKCNSVPGTTLICGFCLVAHNSMSFACNQTTWVLFSHRMPQVCIAFLPLFLSVISLTILSNQEGTMNSFTHLAERTLKSSYPSPNLRI